MLDRVDRLAVVADEQPEVVAVAHELRVQPVGVLVDLDGGLDPGGVEDPLHELPHAVSGGV